MRVSCFHRAGRLTAAVLVSLAGLWAAPASGAKPCDSDAWAFYGAVRDGGGRPLGDAQVFLLLDKIDPAGYATEGVRGRRFRTNDYGKYQAGLVCSDDRDAPNPCAKKLKHLTVAVSSRGHAMQMRIFRLNDLEIVSDDGVCLVHVPEIRLSRSR